jgi:hypothetical protein
MLMVTRNFHQSFHRNIDNSYIGLVLNGKTVTTTYCFTLPQATISDDRPAYRHRTTDVAGVSWKGY